MKLRNQVFLNAILLAAGFASTGSAQDVQGSRDPGLFSRMPHYHIRSFQETQFDANDFVVQKGKDEQKQRVEGHLTSYEYEFDRSAGPPASPLQIQRNYENATLKLGGKVMYKQNQDDYTATFLVARNGQETWVEVSTRAHGELYLLTVAERQAMQQDVVAKADALKSGLAESGHAEVPGIFFDFNKAEVKAESQPALQEVVKLLQGNPSLRVWVVGHTDNVGTVESNVTLSNARAAAVVRSLVQAGIDAKRLTPHGDGPFAPVASNATEEGRARNRRVELVAQP